MASVSDLFKNKIPTIVKGVQYTPFTPSNFEKDYIDTYASEYSPIYDYYQDDIDNKGVITSFAALQGDPIITNDTLDAEKESTITHVEKPFRYTSRITGTHQFKRDDIDVGKMQGFLDEAAKYGIYFRITSGVRPGAVTSSGNISRHAGGYAIDITPIEGESYEQLIDKIRNSPLLDYMVQNGIGFLEEITPEDQKKYNADGANIHISIPYDDGRSEDAAIKSRKKIFGV
mgnify:CR=1 FL=1